MIRLCHVITRSDAIGGAQVHVSDMSRAFSDRGLDVTVLVGGSGPFIDRLKQSNIKTVRLRHLVRPIRPHTDCLAYLELRTSLRELRPDLVMLHSSKAGWLGRLACKHLGIPTVFTAHGWAFTEGVKPLARKAYVFAEQIAGAWTDRIITVSEYDRQLALKARIGQPDSVVTIHNGVPEVAAAPATPANHPPGIIVVARMDIPKEHALLLRALYTLKHLDWSLALVGDGPDRIALERMTQSLGLSERVSFLGARTDVAELLSRAQIFVLPSRWEGFPRSILEAMRASLPVIASDVGGVSESVDHGVTGYRVPRGDLDQMARHLELLLMSPERRKAFGAEGRRDYERRFTFNHMFDETAAVLRDVFLSRNRADLAGKMQHLYS